MQKRVMDVPSAQSSKKNMDSFNFKKGSIFCDFMTKYKASYSQVLTSLRSLKFRANIKPGLTFGRVLNESLEGKENYQLCVLSGETSGDELRSNPVK